MKRPLIKRINFILGDINDISPQLTIELLKHIAVKDKISEIEQVAKSESEIYRQLPPKMTRQFVQNNYGIKSRLIIVRGGIFDFTFIKIHDAGSTLIPNI